MDEPGYRARLRDARDDRHRRRHGLEHHLAEAGPLPDEDQVEEPSQQPVVEQHQLKVPKPAGESTTAYEEPNYRPPEPVDAAKVPGATMEGYGLQGSADIGAPEAAQSRVGARTALQPHLQMMAGPMLRYDTVDVNSNTWHGFCMIVTADAGSSYDPVPSLRLRWEPANATNPSNGHVPPTNGTAQPNGSSQAPIVIEATTLYVYHGTAGSNTFWRFALAVPMSTSELAVHYSINKGHENTFFVPAIGQNMRWVGHSCNGFSAGVDTAQFNGPDPLWNDVLERHRESPYHCVIGGGDQIYCDPLTKEKEIADWINLKSAKDKAKAPLTDEMRFAIDRFLFNHYCVWFRSGAFGKAISCIPQQNILDDHDLIDGFGSYPDALQTSPVFSAIGSRGYFWYLLWQNFIVDEVDGTPSPTDESTKPSKPHPYRSLVFGGDGVYIPFPSHNFLSYLGPNAYILLLDCRAERKKTQVCSKTTYDVIFKACADLPATVTQLVVLLGVPIAYPRMVFIERLLESKINPAMFLATIGLLPGFKNKFDSSAELLDDCNDHWCAQSHKKERNWLITRCQQLAKERKLRVSFLSGDVHCASVGRMMTKGKAVKPEQDHRYMLNVISSAIVNTPPPPALIAMMGRLGAKAHKTLWSSETDEDMVPVFANDLEGKPNASNPRIMGARNYASVRYVDESGELEFDLRMELKRGGGKTKGYTVCAPPPNYV